MKIPSTMPFFRENDIHEISEELQKILRNGRLILGPYTREFERNFREYCGVKHAVAVSSCTAALEIVLRYFDVKGKEVIVPTNTFVATSNAVVYSGGTPVLVDINPDTLCMDPRALIENITPETKGVIIVHIAGIITPEIEEIKQICKDMNLFLIEDDAHAHGAMINGQKAGSLADAGCFSFYPTKVMTTCTGGMITTNDDGLADYAISLRHHGVGKDLENIVNLGNDWLMDEISALLGIYQLKALEDNVKRRNEIARGYAEYLENIEQIELFTAPPNIRYSYYKYPVVLSRNIDKKKLIGKMESEYGIHLGSAYDPPSHLQPAYQKVFGYKKGMFPKAEGILKRVVCLPMFVQMTDEQIKYVLQSFEKVISNILIEEGRVNDSKYPSTELSAVAGIFL
ncbi:UDP-4-amino-4-deoxy-L-arabinose--oxoglutarate aminotransferase [uncultured archaeon]|nr:UDP-4-amino-4-deoxy-L-arabinose--oxoglutarate aminotransferase [uncultured archaeon]